MVSGTTASILEQVFTRTMAGSTRPAGRPELAISYHPKDGSFPWVVEQSNDVCPCVSEYYALVLLSRPILRGEGL